MGGSKYNELILETIDQLRKRKARPDLERICHMLERRHGLKSAEVNEQLSKMVSDGVVIKVDYKGNTSYRNAAKWVRTKSLFKPTCNSLDLANAVQEAVDAISHPGGITDAARCASLHDIEKYLLKRETLCNMNIATLRSALEKEVANGTIRQVRIGEYVSVTPRIRDHSLTEGCPKSSADDLDDDSISHLSRKRIKVIDASVNIVKDTQQEEYCDYCLLASGANRKGTPEGLLVCKDCNMKAHPGCLDYFGAAAERAMSRLWQCSDCKTCSRCFENSVDDMLRICYQCDKGYHVKCSISTSGSESSGVWYCDNCSNTSSRSRDKNQSCDSSNLVPTSSETSKEATEIFVFKKCMEAYPDIVPVADAWTIEEVETFFKCLGFFDEAPAFREQEIDGQSLLLMKRSDVLTGLSLKLGPALKIYSHIKRLQNVVPPEGPNIWVPD